MSSGKDSLSLAAATRVWLKIGCMGFGGPSGQIALLHSEIVEKRGWVGEQEFLRALQFCMLLPGPEAQQLATYLGWRLHGVKGGIVAGGLFVLPAALLLWLLSLLYVCGQGWPQLMAFFAGLKPAVVAIVLSACLRIGKRTLTSISLVLLAALALAILSFTSLPYPFIVLGFGLFGAFFLKQQDEHPHQKPSKLVPSDSYKGSWRASLRTAFLMLIVWLIPIAGLILWLGPHALPAKVGLFFAKVALVSFGGAYAALSYVALHAAHDWGWLTPGEMMDGMGLAETTPGPLLIALQFVAFLAAYKTPGILTPLLAATLASLAACWALFIPSFLWIFSLAPQMERLGRDSRIAGMLSAIGVVVFSVIVHLALWFAGNLFFINDSLPFHVAIVPILIALAALFLLERRLLGMIPVILLCGALGVALKLCFYLIFN